MLHLGVDSLAGDALHFVALPPDTPSRVITLPASLKEDAPFPFSVRHILSFVLIKKDISIDLYL